jgi:hypothetical protein
VPLGITPPEKSAADAGSAPEPVTDQFTVLIWLVLPERVTVKVNSAPLLLPSASIASVAVIESHEGAASSFWITP